MDGPAGGSQGQESFVQLRAHLKTDCPALRFLLRGGVGGLPTPDADGHFSCGKCEANTALVGAWVQTLLGSWGLPEGDLFSECSVVIQQCKVCLPRLPGLTARSEFFFPRQPPSQIGSGEMPYKLASSRWFPWEPTCIWGRGEATPVPAGQQGRHTYGLEGRKFLRKWTWHTRRD